MIRQAVVEIYLYTAVWGFTLVLLAAASRKGLPAGSAIGLVGLACILGLLSWLALLTLDYFLA